MAAESPGSPCHPSPHRLSWAETSFPASSEEASQLAFAWPLGPAGVCACVETRRGSLPGTAGTQVSRESGRLGLGHWDPQNGCHEERRQTRWTKTGPSPVLHLPDWTLAGHRKYLLLEWMPERPGNAGKQSARKSNG